MKIRLVITGPIYAKRRTDRKKDGQDEVNRPRFLSEKEERYKVRRKEGIKRRKTWKENFTEKNQERRGE